MTDFALYHEGKWRDGEASKISGATYVVSYDTTNQAYHIDKSDYDDFVEWVALNWQTESRAKKTRKPKITLSASTARSGRFEA